VRALRNAHPNDPRGPVPPTIFAQGHFVAMLSLLCDALELRLTRKTE
jgi:hypothetical protein